MAQVYKDGITKTIKDKYLKEYLDMGFKEVTKPDKNNQKKDK
jgi:hypothetical protein